MEQINSLLNLTEHATASDRACAVYELLQETDKIQAARTTSERQLSALREATSHIFAESICAARGITDASAQEDIRAAWCADPYAALNAFAGENITAANPYGCNQYGHEWRAKHGEGWRGGKQHEDTGGKQPEDTLETLAKRKFEKGVKSQDLADKIVKLAKKTEVEKDRNKIKEINIKIKKLSEEKKKLDNEIQDISMKEVELRDRERYNNSQEKKSGPPKGKNLADALKKIAPRTDKNGQGLMPFADNKSDAEIDNFEKASTDKKREILSGWKQKVRDARARKDGTEKKETENLFNKIRKIGKKRGWSKEKLDSTLKGIELEVKSDYDTLFS